MPPSEEYFVRNFSDDIFRNVLNTDATKDDGMNAVAKYYQVKQQWNDYKNSIGIQHTRQEKYFNLLLIVKTKVKWTIFGSVSLKVYINILQYYFA